MSDFEKDLKVNSVSRRKTIRRRYNKVFMLTHMDYTVFFIVMFLVVFGIIMVYSTSFNIQLDEGERSPYEKQIIFAVVGFVAMYLISVVQVRVINKWAILGYLFTIGLLILVLRTGTVINGSRRWTEVAGVRIQPSEIAKFTMIIVMAGVLTAFKDHLTKIQVITLWIFILIVPLLLIGLSDFSTAVIVAVICFAIVFVAYQLNLKTIAVWIVSIVFFGGLGVSMIMLFSYRRERIDVFFKGPWEYADSFGRQTIQALYAIGSGGLTGVGLGQSIQKLGYISEAQNDIIFAVICEELGLFGGLAIIGLFMLLLYRIAQIAMNAKSMNHFLIAVGVMTHIGLQGFLNIGVAVGFVPVTGVPLPFISSGGSSLIMLMVEIGLVLNVSRHNVIEEMIG